MNNYSKKMNKKIIQDIKLLIKDLKINGKLTNQDILNSFSKNNIKNLIINIISSIHNIPNINLYDSYIDLLLTISLNVYNPVYNRTQLNYINKIIKNLKLIKQPEQRTPEWYEFRNNRLTASDLGTVIGVNPYENYDSIIKKKCGFEKPFYMNKSILKGIKYEDVIIQIYKYLHNVDVFEYGCIGHPNINHFGASPDGIVDSNSKNKNYIGRMLEIKCPSSREITGFIPDYYLAQVQGQLEVCNLDYCDFVECKIEEYNDIDEYFNDYHNINNYHLNSNKLFKGCLIESFDIQLNKNVFYYCDLDLNREEILKWESKIIDSIFDDENLEYIKTTYWKSIEYNELLIKRDKKYFNELCLPKINKFWKDVLYYRENKHLLQNKNKKENTFKKKVINFTSKQDFLSDSD